MYECQKTAKQLSYVQSFDDNSLYTQQCDRYFASTKMVESYSFRQSHAFL